MTSLSLGTLEDVLKRGKETCCLLFDYIHSLCRVHVRLSMQIGSAPLIRSIIISLIYHLRVHFYNL